MEGIIKENGTVLGEDGSIYFLPIRGRDTEGYFEVLVDAKSIGLKGFFMRQSIKFLIGERVSFVPNGDGYNYKVII